MILDNFGPGGITGLIIGPPKTGKSTFLGSWAEIVDPAEIELICPKPQEIDSWLYQKYGLNESASIFRDHNWMPSVDQYEADAYLRLMRHILALYRDDTKKVVLLDPFTDAVQLAAHDLLKGERAATPKDVRNSAAFYGALQYRLRDLAQALVGLASKDLPQPKHVFVAVHAQPTKEEDLVGKETADARGKGVEFYGDVMPQIEGGYRRAIAGEFSLVGYSTIKHDFKRDEDGKVLRPATKETKYLVQFRPDEEKHGGIRMAPLLDGRELPNNINAVLEAVMEARGREEE